MCRILRGGGTKAIVVDIILVVGLLLVTFYFLRRQGIVGLSNRSTFKSSSGQVVDFQQNLSSRTVSASHFPRNTGESSSSPATQQQHYVNPSHGGSRELAGGGQRGKAGGNTGGNAGGNDASPNVIEARIKLINDMRSEKCQTEVYTHIKESVSIVIHFNEYQFYNLKTTISSILHVVSDRIAEIIIVDDGTTLRYIIDECEAYVKSLRGVRLIRHSTQLGELKSRLAGYNEAKSDIVVFLDVSVVVSKGWLEPLIDLLGQHPNVIAMPHYDNIHDPVTMDYRPTHISLVASWTWNLAIRMRPSPDIRILEDSRYVTSPALPGNAFAVRKLFFDRMGQLDEGMEDGGGEYLDLSLKTWLCEGSIMIATCSRIGILNLFAPIKVRSRLNIRHIIHTYFGSYTQAALRLNGMSSGPLNVPHRTGSKAPPDISKCRDMDWYLKNIRNETRPPSSDVLHYGVMRVHSGRCARINPSDARVDLTPCADFDNTEQPIEYTNTGRLRLPDGRCLTTTPSAYIVADHCRANDTMQDWKYKDSFEIVNVWSGFCARHVTDPDKNTTSSRQIAMSQMCTGEPSNNDIFKQWSFIPV